MKASWMQICVTLLFGLALGGCKLDVPVGSVWSNEGSDSKDICRGKVVSANSEVGVFMMQLEVQMKNGERDSSQYLFAPVPNSVNIDGTYQDSSSREIPQDLAGNDISQSDDDYRFLIRHILTQIDHKTMKDGSYNLTIRQVDYQRHQLLEKSPKRFLKAKWECTDVVLQH